MEKGTSKGDDNLRSKSAKKKKNADQPSADDLALPSEVSGRIHIFKGKPLPGASPKPDGQPLRCSSFRTKTPAHSVHGLVQSAKLAVVQPPILTLRDELTRLKKGIQTRTKVLYDAAMKAEDLEAIVQALHRTCHRISQRRK